MKRLLAVSSLLMLVAAICPQQQTTQTDDGGSQAQKPEESALASLWGALAGVTDRLGLDAEQETQVAEGIEEDATGDQYHPGGELTPMSNTDITRFAAFSIELDQAKVDNLFNDNNAVFPCSAPGDVANITDGVVSTWCTSPNIAMPAGTTNFYCGEVMGMFPTEVSDQNTNYEYGVAFRHPEDQNFSPSVEGDLFTNSNLAVGARYSSDGPTVFRLRYQGEGDGFREEELPYKVLLTYAEGQSTFCGVIPQMAIGDQDPYPFRMFSFCGNFQRGAADIYPNNIEEFHPPLTIRLQFEF